MSEFIAILKSLKIPTLNPDELAALRQLEQEWRHWRERELATMPTRIMEQQNAAYAAFLDAPTEENEHRLIVLADPVLTQKRYALLRRAFIELRGRISAKAAVILTPVVERIREAVAAEHKHWLEKAEPVMGSRDRAPAVKEVRAALDCIEYIHRSVFRACGGHSDETPFQLAGGLVKE